MKLLELSKFDQWMGQRLGFLVNNYQVKSGSTIRVSDQDELSGVANANLNLVIKTRVSTNQHIGTVWRHCLQSFYSHSSNRLVEALISMHGPACPLPGPGMNDALAWRLMGSRALESKNQVEVMGEWVANRINAKHKTPPHRTVPRNTIHSMQ